MTISIIYWNMWLDNQTQGTKREKLLLSALEKLVNDYHPDFFGLNEVIQKQNSVEMPPTIALMKRLGYPHVHYLPSRPWDQHSELGLGIVSKHPFASLSAISLGEKHSKIGYPEAIDAYVTLPNGRQVEIVVVHLPYLSLRTLPLHFKYQHGLTDFIRQHEPTSPLILGGDTNEPTHMPFSFAARNQALLHARTGDLGHPTWTLKARRSSLIRANPDKIFWPRGTKLELRNFKVVNLDQSDHRPIFAKFELRA